MMRLDNIDAETITGSRSLCRLHEQIDCSLPDLPTVLGTNLHSVAKMDADEDPGVGVLLSSLRETGERSPRWTRIVTGLTGFER
jgi:hypothetical protein